jgi:nucleotide-binding universal stress UspA family protein
MVSTVAVGVDGSGTAAEAVKMAVELARRFDAELVLLSVYRHGDDASASEADDAELRWQTTPSARQHEVVARTEERLRRDGVRCSTVVGDGHPGEVLVRLADECGADVLVVGNKGMHRRALGSIPNTVTHRAGCSVFVVKTT